MAETNVTQQLHGYHAKTHRFFAQEPPNGLIGICQREHGLVCRVLITVLRSNKVKCELFELNNQKTSILTLKHECGSVMMSHCFVESFIYLWVLDFLKYIYSYKYNIFRSYIFWLCCFEVHHTCYWAVARNARPWKCHTRITFRNDSAIK